MRKIITVVTMFILSLSPLRAEDDPVRPPTTDYQLPEPATVTSEVETRLNALQSEVEQLRQFLAESEKQSDLSLTTPAPAPAAETEASVYPRIKISGFFQYDAGWIHQSPSSTATLGDIEDVTGFRRARLAAMGDVAENVSYKFELDFGFPGRPSFTDVWLDIHDVKFLGNVKIGQWKQPFFMDAMTSVRELMFFERALPFAFIPFRQIGIGFHDTNADETMTWAMSGFRYPTDPWGNIGSPLGIGPLGDRGYGMSGRATGILLEDTSENGSLIHLGAGYAFLSPGNHTIDYRNSPEFGGPLVGPSGSVGSMPFFVETGAIPTQNINLYNAEIGARYGSLYGQSEVTYAVVQDPSGNSMRFPGAYSQIGYFLTGEERAYNKTLGAFGRVKPYCDFGKQGWGAWEVAFRYSYLNLNEVSLLGPTTPGGRLSDLTYGLNWYLNQYAKMQFNYTQALLDRRVGGHSETGIFAVRAQLDF